MADTFEEEAAVTKANLARFEQFDRAYSSPLTRATKLAAYCGHADATTDPRLKEMNMGEWEMQKFDEIKDENLQNGMMTTCTWHRPGAKAFLNCTAEWPTSSTNCAAKTTAGWLCLHTAGC